MNSTARNGKPHVVCVPFPAQGHINPMFKLAKLLHFHNFHITFVNTEHNRRRLLKSQGPNSLDGLPDFQFKTIPDGLPPSDADATQDIPSLCDSTSKHCLGPFVDLLSQLGSTEDLPKVTCVIADCGMGFSFDAADKFEIPCIFLSTPSACGRLVYAQYHNFVEKGLIPLRDASYLTNGFMETTIDWIPGMKNIPLKYLPSFFRATDKDDVNLNFMAREQARYVKASAFLFNTFDVFEKNVLEVLSLSFPRMYTIGPLQLLVKQIRDKSLEDISSNLWKEEPECIEWLDSKEPNSVVYVNFGSITVITPEQMTEFAWGLADSKKSFLWIIRPDLVKVENAMLPPEFVEETKDRGILASWCKQEEILKHAAIGGFLSHMGWNSILDSICGGVPMICWPFFAEQHTNCWFACREWGVGMEINNNVKRDEVEKLVRELMEGEKGKAMKKKAMEWKAKAEEATRPGGSSYTNLDELVRFIRGN